MNIKRLISSIIIITFVYTSVPANAGMNFSGLGSSPLKKGEFVLSGQVFKAAKGKPIETLVTLEQVARASKKEKKIFHSKIRMRFHHLTLLGSSTEKVEALYNATGFRKHIDEKEYIIINGKELRTAPGIPIEDLVTPEKMAEASLEERVYAKEVLRNLLAVLKYRRSSRVEKVEALYNATGLRKLTGSPRINFKTSINIKSLRTTRSNLRKSVKEGTGDTASHLETIRKINKRLLELGENTEILEGESSSPVSDSINMLDGEVGSVVYGGSVVVKTQIKINQ